MFIIKFQDLLILKNCKKKKANMNILVFSIVWFKDSVYILSVNKLAAFDEKGATGKSPLTKLIDN